MKNQTSLKQIGPLVKLYVIFKKDDCESFFKIKDQIIRSGAYLELLFGGPASYGKSSEEAKAKQDYIQEVFLVDVKSAELITKWVAERSG